MIPELRTALEDVAVADDAAPMAAYMRDRQPFLGIKTPARRAASKPFIRATKSIDIEEVLDLIDDLWAESEREFQYVGQDTLRANDRRLLPEHIERIRTLIVTKSWWDTVDALAPSVGTIVLNHPDAVATMDDWIEDANFWLARVAIIHQLRFKDRTDADRLFRYSQRRAHDTEFFIRKAIGWALRQYARTDPGAVLEFVDANIDDLSGLTIREATKHL